MSKSIAVSLAAFAMLGAGIVAVPVATREAVTTASFWQMHTAAPSATETHHMAELRLAARQIAEPIVAALR